LLLPRLIELSLGSRESSSFFTNFLLDDTGIIRINGNDFQRNGSGAHTGVQCVSDYTKIFTVHGISIVSDESFCVVLLTVQFVGLEGKSSIEIEIGRRFIMLSSGVSFIAFPSARRSTLPSTVLLSLFSVLFAKKSFHFLPAVCIFVVNANCYYFAIKSSSLIIDLSESLPLPNYPIDASQGVALVIGDAFCPSFPVSTCF
jgi:hypothetical protein